ncbi:MAG: enoyl-CoA hydratase/isomerase family protein [Acidimicrobiia bacterium]|nr:enoyl-CoA hydratase/isomerase family protein [Acidimicrobiia bacterium]
MSYSSVDGLQVALDDAGVLRLTLDRPDKRNAIDDGMVAGLIDAVESAGKDEAVRAILLTGNGDHFCGGFDILGRNQPSGQKRRAGSIQRRLPSQAHRLIPLLLTVQTPVVCAARGWAAGIGLHLLLAADVAVVSDDARLWEPFTERGFTPDSGGTWLLPRRIGEVRARDMLLVGRAVDGATAFEWGLVHRSVPDDELEAGAEAVVVELAKGPTVALGLTKWLLHAGASVGLEEHLRNEAFALELSSRSEDFREGLSAFQEKRPPEFKGR